MRKTYLPFILALICVLLLGACAPKQVENKEIEVIFDGSTRKCLYTGEYLMKPVGVGDYKFTEDGEVWVFTGEAGEKSEIGTGSVEDMPLVVKHDGKKYETYYTGELVDSKPVDPIQIRNFTYKLKYEDNELEGLYTGSIFNNLPDGTGEFVYENKGDYFEYSGSWKAGSMSGKGNLKSNIFIVHLSYADRVGNYSGETIDGVAKGEGTFSSKNSEGISYTYTGMWENGLFEGAGRCVFDDDDAWIQEGNYSAGEYKPSVADFYVSLGSPKNYRYRISDKEYEFIEAHESYFSGGIQEVDEEFIDKSFKYEEFSKNPSAFELSIVKVAKLSVAQVYEFDDCDYHCTFIFALDSKYRAYYINMIGSAPSIVEGSRIQIIAMPVDYFAYQNVYGNSAYAIACIGMAVLKQ